MKNLRNKNQPPNADLVQTYLQSSWDKVLAVYNNLTQIKNISDAIDAGTLDEFLTAEDINTLAELNAILTDADLGRFATQAEAEAGVDNTVTMTPLRVAQAIAVLAAGLQHNYAGAGAPTVTDDADAGYSAGSIWFDVSADPDETYRCTDPTVGAAVWIKTSLTSDELATVAVSGDSDDLIEGVAQLLMTAAERAKLAGIEDNATADMTDAEIVAGYANVVGPASQAEAEAGTEIALRTWSPLRVKQAIDALGGSGSLSNIVEDLTPQLGGTLDTNGQEFTGDIIPSADSTDDLGSVTKAFAEAHIDTLRAKESVRLEGAYLVSGLPSAVTYKDSIIRVVDALAPEIGATVVGGGGVSVLVGSDGTNWKVFSGGTMPAGGGSAIEVEDEGSSLTTGVTKFNFAGAGVTVTEPVADEVLVTIPGGGAGSLPSGGTLGQLLIKQSATDGDADWGDVDFSPLTVYETASGTTYSSSAYASKGEIFYVTSDRYLQRVRAWLGGDASATYKLVLAKCTDTINSYPISELVTESSAFPADVSDRQVDWDITDGTILLESGVPYALLVVRTDGTATSPCETIFISSAAATDTSNNVVCLGSSRYASNDPQVSDVTFYSASSTVRMEISTESQYLYDNYGPGSGGGLTTVIVSDDYTASAGEKIKVKSSVKSIEITLPAGNNLDNIVIQDADHNAGTNYITVTPNGSETIDDDTAFIIDQDSGDIDISYESANTNWLVSPDGTPSVVNVNDFATGFSDVNAQTGTTYTFVEADLTKCVRANNAAASTYSIPDGFAAVGETLNILNVGAGLVTIQMAGGATDTLASSANTCPQDDAVTIVKDTATSWRVIGGTA